jgi:hypothetical protein
MSFSTLLQGDLSISGVSEQSFVNFSRHVESGAVPDLTSARKPVPTIFDLLGKKENDLTYSLGWALFHVPMFTRASERLADHPRRT